MRQLAEHRFPARSMNAPGAVVLRDLGPETAERFAVHWRNEQSLGYYEGSYHGTLEEAVATFEERVAREMRLQEEFKGPGKGPYEWALWGSDRSEGNDDCWTGGWSGSLEQALSDMRRAQTLSLPWTHAYLQSPEGLVRFELNPAPRPSPEDGTSADISEAASMAGMASGVRGTNEVYGEDIDEDPPRRGL